MDIRSVDDLAAAIRSARKSEGLTQEELALLAGVGRITLTRLERAIGNVSFETALAVTAALGLTITVSARRTPATR
ncbi:helix-turn-helix domain-containing protein [Hyphobacterium sp. SN044]|uniref:helix-turn-helix transcriptional regulator n=1 Tax=Hyphobacterium sp. SN044 TaxID=2912575 RepID=UPI001F39AD6D|nr:helix-turn-helix domain-containing protein [Hyphobacterium sp. SN044]MCF8880738.1 helix-turn-helix domain-containing protein [Hyphobacterium sp. SN044]